MNNLGIETRAQPIYFKRLRYIDSTHKRSHLRLFDHRLINWKSSQVENWEQAAKEELAKKSTLLQTEETPQNNIISFKLKTHHPESDQPQKAWIDVTDSMVSKVARTEIKRIEHDRAVQKAQELMRTQLIEAHRRKILHNRKSSVVIQPRTLEERNPKAIVISIHKAFLILFSFQLVVIALLGFIAFQVHAKTTFAPQPFATASMTTKNQPLAITTSQPSTTLIATKTTNPEPPKAALSRVGVETSRPNVTKALPVLQIKTLPKEAPTTKITKTTKKLSGVSKTTRPRNSSKIAMKKMPTYNSDVLNFENDSRRIPSPVLASSKKSKPKKLVELSSQQVFQILAQRLPEFKSCNRIQQSIAPIKGNLKIRFSINPAGWVTQSPTLDPSFVDTEIGKCTSKVIQRIKFPGHDKAPKSFQFQFLVN